MSRETNRYLDPLSNFGFEHLFGNESKKEILIEFLNVLFRGENNIVNTVRNPKKNMDTEIERKELLMDLTCTDKDGSEFTLEIQRLEEHNFHNKNRNFINRHLKNATTDGKTYSEFPGVNNYLVGFLEFPLNDEIKYLHFKDVTLMEESARKTLSGTLGFKFLEIPSFHIGKRELFSEMDKWIYVLKNMVHLNKRPEVLNSPIFKKIFKLAEIENFTAEERNRYDADLKAKLEYENSTLYKAEKAAYEAKKSKASKIEVETILDCFPFDIIVKIRKLTPEQVKEVEQAMEKRRN